jgi:hypothetical protein
MGWLDGIFSQQTALHATFRICQFRYMHLVDRRRLGMESHTQSTANNLYFFIKNSEDSISIFIEPIDQHFLFPSVGIAQKTRHG